MNNSGSNNKPCKRNTLILISRCQTTQYYCFAPYNSCHASISVNLPLASCPKRNLKVCNEKVLKNKHCLVTAHAYTDQLKFCARIISMLHAFHSCTLYTVAFVSNDAVCLLKKTSTYVLFLTRNCPILWKV